MPGINEMNVEAHGSSGARKSTSSVVDGIWWVEEISPAGGTNGWLEWIVKQYGVGLVRGQKHVLLQM